MIIIRGGGCGYGIWGGGFAGTPWVSKGTYLFLYCGVHSTTYM